MGERLIRDPLRLGNDTPVSVRSILFHRIDTASAQDIVELVEQDRPPQGLDLAAGSRFKLVETLAERIAELLHRDLEIPWVRVKVIKPGAVEGAGDVGIIIERGRRHGERGQVDAGGDSETEHPQEATEK